VSFNGGASVGLSTEWVCILINGQSFAERDCPESEEGMARIGFTGLKVAYP